MIKWHNIEIYNSIYPVAVYLDRLGPSVKFVNNYTKLSCFGNNQLLDQVECSINNCPTRCNTKQSIYYSANSTLHVSGVNHTHQQQYTKL